MKFILGKKIEMTQRFSSTGAMIPVTVVEAGPCTVSQIKKNETDGYNAVQIGFGKVKKISKPVAGHLKDLEKSRYLKEFRLDDDKFEIPTQSEPIKLERGTKINADVFLAGDKIFITSISKGKGFAGVVKRHHFKGHPATRGTKDQLRMPGSIGATGPQHVTKGMRMGGHMGNRQVTIKNLEIVEVIPEKNLLLIKGAVPGARNSLIVIKSA